MQTITKQYNVYKFSELSEDAKEKVVQWYSQYLYDWYEYPLEQLKEVAEYLGIDITDIYWSGFWNQGDGACFEGYYSYKKGALKKIKSEFPKWVELHDMAQRLQAIQKKAFYSVTAKVKHSGHYYHEYCTNIDVDMHENISQDTFSDIEDAVIEILRDYMRLCYKYLEECYEYEVSAENVAEMAECNEWLFTEDGDFF